MSRIAKLVLGTLVVLYGVYGYLSGEIYALPGRHARDLLRTGAGVLPCALSYVAFGSAFYVWLLPLRAEHGARKRRTIKKYKERAMIGLAILGIILQGASGFMEFFME